MKLKNNTLFTLLLIALVAETTSSQVTYVAQDNGTSLSTMKSAAAHFYYKNKKGIAIIATLAIGSIAAIYFKNDIGRILSSADNGPCAPLVTAKDKPTVETFDGLCAKSRTFNTTIGAIPTINNRIKNIAHDNIEKQLRIADHANSARPIIHAKTMQLMKDFLEYKGQYGSDIEKEFYSQMTVPEFITRLLMNRPLSFVGSGDAYLLTNIDRSQPQLSNGAFEKIGTSQESGRLTLENYLSYDEQQIASLISVSVPTYFINHGARNNKAAIGRNGTYQEEGISIGVVGPRFQKPGRMEDEHIFIRNNSGLPIPNDSPWVHFYNNDLVTDKIMLDTIMTNNPNRFIKCTTMCETALFDTRIYQARIRMVVEPFLLEANARGAQCNKEIYIHAVGLGLGAWMPRNKYSGRPYPNLTDKVLSELMTNVYYNVLENHELPHIKDIDFSWFPAENIKYPKREFGKNTVKIHYSKRNPAAKLTGKDKDKLVVAMYAWDGNAYSGNEYWDAGRDPDRLFESSDSAAACCSTIPELQNPQINSKINGHNVATYPPDEKDEE